MRQLDIDGLFSKGSPKKCGDLYLMPHQLSHSGKDADGWWGVSFYKKRGKFCIIQFFFLPLQQHRPA